MSAPSVIAVFGTEDALLAGVKAARDAGLEVRDAYTPFAVHGLDDAMALRRSRLPWVCFAAGLTGGTLALSFQIWTAASSWPLNVGGKPFVSLPAFIPVTFEVTVLFAAITSVVTFFVRSSLWPGKGTRVLSRVTDDQFALEVEDSGDAAKVLRDAGALEISAGGAR